MKGFVPTPAPTVDQMVDLLFQRQPPHEGTRLLDPGCGHGAFIEGVFRWCQRNGAPIPQIVGIDLDPSKLVVATRAIGDRRRVSLIEGDFLTQDLGTFDYIVGNPPYVGIEALSEDERALYRRLFVAARGRLDLYLLFWERALRLLRPDGRVVFITPEKFTYVETARPLRKLMALNQIEELRYVPENTFPGLTTYPVVTSIRKSRASAGTRIQSRSDVSHFATLPGGGESWQPAIKRSPVLQGAGTLADIALRISCGVATGADSLFLSRPGELPAACAQFSRDVMAGRQLHPGQPLPQPTHLLFMPYDAQGQLLSLDRLGQAAEYLQRPHVRQRLEARTCVDRKPWYAFHETPPLRDMLRPKLICKDIAREPHFWADESGHLVPLHSTYYIVPAQPSLLHPLADYLNSESVKAWLCANSQRAANGYIRTQSAMLKRLPIPASLMRWSGQQRLAA